MREIVCIQDQMESSFEDMAEKRTAESIHLHRQVWRIQTDIMKNLKLGALNVNLQSVDLRTR